MASNMAAQTSEWPYIWNYQLKFDDFGVYSQMHGGKEHALGICPDILGSKECIKSIEIKSNTPSKMAAAENCEWP